MSRRLVLEGVTAGYGQTVVLNGVSLVVPTGGVAVLLGRNGVGKTTLLSTIMGVTTLHGGSIKYGDHRIDGMATESRMRLGLGHVPQGRDIFPSLTVEENLRVASRRGGWPLNKVYGLFPNLRERRSHGGFNLSGGEQQMLAIGRALSGAPEVLLLDEPTEGLAPVMVDAVIDALREIRRESGISILLVEHKVELALSLADDVYVLDRGEVIHRSPATEVRGTDILEQKIFASGKRVI